MEKRPGKYAAHARGLSSPGWGEIQPHPDDEFDLDVVETPKDVAIVITSNVIQDPPASTPVVWLLLLCRVLISVAPQLAYQLVAVSAGCELL